ncbi:flippase [Trichococcus shcherbakoviae]|uniref:Flippase n=1 Tax=Trichococcus shcherbakoviae subsp. psychrophilus TaxID=2585775 RepID=A0A5C5E5M5_9LACT|nr:flippase [Trichococcus shcherbakoviae]TNV68456.1 flippase [Trichococcus shcherbakoviae subsp. psychrophilus]
MQKIKSIKYNFIMNFILTASSLIFPLITFPYVSRILLPEGNGKIAFVSSIISYFSMFAMLGIPTYGIRTCAKVRENKEELSRTVQELIIINIVTTTITYIILIISLFIVPKFEEYRTLIIINSIGLILNSFGMNWLYQALEQYSYITVRSLIFKVLSILLMFLFIHDKNDYILYSAITVFASSGSNVINIINIRKYIYIKPVGSYHLKKHIKPIMTFFAMSVATSVYINMDTVMLGFMRSDNEVGLYNAAVKIKAILTALVASLGTVLLPRMSYYINTNKKNEFKDMTAKALNFVILISLPLTIYFIVYAKEVIMFLSGSNYLGAIPTMQIITPTIIFIGLTNVLGIQVLLPLNRERGVLISVIVGAIVNIAINMILIPKMGADGAALGTLFAEFSVLIVQTMSLQSILADIRTKINLRYGMVSCAVASISIPLLKLVHFNSILTTLIMSTIVFFCSYGIVLLIQGEPLTKEFIFGKFKKNKLRRT